MAEVIRVSALNRYVKARFEEDELLQDLALRGEIANFVHHRSGHLYFTLRDENASVKAVMFRQNAQRLSFTLVDINLQLRTVIEAVMAHTG